MNDKNLTYRYCMDGAIDAGERRHPQLVIREFAPDAHGFEAVTIADCWLFVATEITNPPTFIECVQE